MFILNKKEFVSMIEKVISINAKLIENNNLHELVVLPKRYIKIYKRIKYPIKVNNIVVKKNSIENVSIKEKIKFIDSLIAFLNIGCEKFSEYNIKYYKKNNHRITLRIRDHKGIERKIKPKLISILKDIKYEDKIPSKTETYRDEIYKLKNNKEIKIIETGNMVKSSWYVKLPNCITLPNSIRCKKEDGFVTIKNSESVLLRRNISKGKY